MSCGGTHPQMLKIADGDVAATWVLDLWDLAPTPGQSAPRLRAAPVEKLLKHHHIRRIDADTVLRNLQEPAIKVGRGVAEAASVHLRSLFTRLRVDNRELRQADAKLDALCAAIGETDADLGRGPSTTGRHDPQIDARHWQNQSRDIAVQGLWPLSRRDYPALRTLCGAAPVTKRSGKSHIVIMRYASHVRLRNVVYHWARVATQHDPKSRERYAALRRRGKSHGRALRGVADRLLRPSLCPVATTDAVRSELRPSKVACASLAATRR